MTKHTASVMVIAPVVTNFHWTQSEIWVKVQLSGSTLIKVLDSLHPRMAEKIYFHHSEIQSGGGFATLNDGQAVEFEVAQGEKGPCANKVQAI